MSFKEVKYFSLFIFIAVVIWGCEPDQKATIDYKYRYFPVDLGHWVIYQVDSTTYDDFYVPPRVETQSYQIKEVIESIFKDNENRDTYRIERFKRDSVTDPWVLINVWVANRTRSTAERVENNLRFIKLVFPVIQNASWSGNKFIFIGDNGGFDLSYLEDWDYTYEEIDQPLVMNSIMFDTTVTVLQRDRDIGIQLDYFKEIYAQDVGLIYKEARHLEQNTVDFTWETPQRGFDVIFKIIDYSKP